MLKRIVQAILVAGVLLGADGAAQSVQGENPGAYPVMKRAKYNPAVRLVVQGDSAYEMGRLVVTLADPGQVERIVLRSGPPNGMNFKDSKEYGEGRPGKSGKVVIKCEGQLPAGKNVLWLDIEPGEDAVIGSKVTVEKVVFELGDKEVEAAMQPVSQRIGIMLAFPGEKVGQLKGAPRDCAAFRIPGIIRTRKGTLLAVFDARYRNEKDLCDDIDVAVVRSTDGGQTWTLPEVNMDSGPGAGNGCGDPCILQDKKGRIWVQALACHFAPGARAINASGKGTDPAKTGQWEMVYSDNDGKTWSRIVNVTEQVKEDEWTLVLAGPGNGICTRDGVIVFPAQIWQGGAAQCNSTICYSKDGGRKWTMAKPVPHKTSECQVVELEDGSLMLNCRNEARSGKRAVFVTKDLGETWEAHPTHLQALREPTCQASLVAVESKEHGRLLLFSNPASGGRNHMTLRASKDEGKTWNEGLMYDVRGCMGYSCVAMTDPDHVGVIYETCHNNGVTGCRGIGFIRLPLETVVTGNEVEVKPAKTKSGKKSKKARKKAGKKKNRK